MKEATGELNMTVIVVISVGILSAFFFSFIWPMINSNFQATAQCNKAVCDCSESGRSWAKSKTGNKNFCKCAQTKEKLGSSETFTCPFKG